MGEWTREALAQCTDARVAAISGRYANRLAKWRAVFAGWQLGTRLASDPESQAVHDHREATLMLRAEVNTLTALLIEAGVITPRTLTEQLVIECEAHSAALARRFPGMEATDDGIAYHMPEAAETMKGWLP